MILIKMESERYLCRQEIFGRTGDFFEFGSKREFEGVFNVFEFEGDKLCE